jgi:uncharacterized protein YyaL (SSP411 family)
MAVRTLEKMAAGGLRDHLGGGFHRYATDQRWLIPHFEKMLYDNALLASAYTEAWQATGNEEFRDVARETLDYVAREMTAPDGAFYSATDADSRAPNGEMEEGWFFTWTPAEIDALVSAEDAAAFKAWYGVTSSGNFEGRTILHTWKPSEEVATGLGISVAELKLRVERARPVLLAARAHRPAPLLDDKVLTGWNGLMVSAFARAAFAFDDLRYLETANRAADALLRRARSRDGRLSTVATESGDAGPAFLEDHAFLIAGLLDLYEAGGDAARLEAAIELQQLVDTLYTDNLGGGYFRTANDAEGLIVREKPEQDGAVPSGNSVTALNLLRLHAMTTDMRYLASASLIFSAQYPALTKQPTRSAELLIALDFQLEATREIGIVRSSDDSGESARLLEILRTRFLPNRVLSVVEPGPNQAAAGATIPWVKAKLPRGGRATAYVCVDQVCDFPVVEPAKLVKQVEPRLYGESSAGQPGGADRNP